MLGYSGDGGAGTSALLWTPHGATTDGAGGIVWSEQGNHILRHLNSYGTVVRIAGNGARGFSGDGGRSVKRMLRASAKKSLPHTPCFPCVRLSQCICCTAQYSTGCVLGFWSYYCRTRARLLRRRHWQPRRTPARASPVQYVLCDAEHYADAFVPFLVHADAIPDAVCDYASVSHASRACDDAQRTPPRSLSDASTRRTRTHVGSLPSCRERCQCRVWDDAESHQRARASCSCNCGGAAVIMLLRRHG